ncbi:MAG: sigma-70 family RNA polymerase sigma factor [Acidobacteria bacterium]|nr:sigma-70 family RNA polymerase sigma factor [Acidobacteriota bacterium]
MALLDNESRHKSPDSLNIPPSEDTQLSSGEGVKKGVGTIALNPEMYPGVAEKGSNGPGTLARSVAAKPLTEMSDAEVMLLAGAGDDSAFEYLIEKFRRPIISFMYRMTHNQAVAEELAQEVFLRVYRSRSSYQAEAKFSTWLYRIATNLGVNYARDTRSERTAPSVNLDEADPETGTTPDVADAKPTVEAELLREERLAAIRKHVMALPERQRTAVLMHKYQGLDYKEIGSVLKLSESATKSLLFRAYETLRERLKEFV